MESLSLVCRGFEGWFVIATEDGGSISDAMIEGTADEMLAIAAAIETEGAVQFKRCAVDCSDKGAALWSPRNSTAKGILNRADAVRLVATIRAAIPPETEMKPHKCNTTFLSGYYRISCPDCSWHCSANSDTYARVLSTRHEEEMKRARHRAGRGQ